MNNLFLGFTAFGVLIFALAWALSLFDFSFTESGQEPRCMGGQVPDVGYGAKERVADNKKKIRERRNPKIQDI